MICTDNNEDTLRKIRQEYRKDLFANIKFRFQKQKKLLDVGCGDGEDGLYLINKFRVKYYGTDIYKDKNITKRKIRFTKGSITSLPFKAENFDYIFVHDVIHHIDEKDNCSKKILKGLKELRRVCKKKGYIIIVEGNRYNPLGYIHMVRQWGHNHLSQKNFQKIVNTIYSNDVVSISSFEVHPYPPKLEKIYRIYEKIMNTFIFERFRSYNLAVVKKNENSS